MTACLIVTKKKEKKSSNLIHLIHLIHLKDKNYLKIQVIMNVWRSCPHFTELTFRMIKFCPLKTPDQFATFAALELKTPPLFMDNFHTKSVVILAQKQFLNEKELVQFVGGKSKKSQKILQFKILFLFLKTFFLTHLNLTKQCIYSIFWNKYN